MSPNTPNRIHPSRLLLNPNGSPVPSVVILSSTRDMAGLDMVAAHRAATSDALMPTLEAFAGSEGFPSAEHLTLPFIAIAGNPVAIVIVEKKDSDSERRFGSSYEYISLFILKQ